MRRKRRHFLKKKYSFTHRKSLLSARNIKDARSLGNEPNSTVLCIQASLLDSLSLHLELSKNEAMIYVVNHVVKDAAKKPHLRGWQDVKVPNKPILYSYTIFKDHKLNKTMIEVVQTSQVLVRRVEDLWERAAEEALRQEVLT